MNILVLGRGLSMSVNVVFIDIALRCRYSANFSVAKCKYSLLVFGVLGLVILIISSSLHSSCVYFSSSCKNSLAAINDKSFCDILL